jgi:hypothetical protein
VIVSHIGYDNMPRINIDNYFTVKNRIFCLEHALLNNIQLLISYHFNVNHSKIPAYSIIIIWYLWYNNFKRKNLCIIVQEIMRLWQDQAK